jgi:large subunit ribosomal protein L31
MRKSIHPDYAETTVVCSCGSTFVTRSTAGGTMHVELCSQCHPFYTGKQKFVDTGGRVQRFSDKFGNAADAVMDKHAAEKEARIKAAEEAKEAARAAKVAKDAEKAGRRGKREAHAAAEFGMAEDAEPRAEVVTEAPAEIATEAPVEDAAAEPAEETSAE